MIKRRIARLLIALLEPKIQYRDIDDEKIEGWLAEQGKDMRFHDYFRKRDLTLLKVMGQGLSREDYLMRVGQRLELLNLIDKVDKASKSKDARVALVQRQAEREKLAKKQDNQSKT